MRTSNPVLSDSTFRGFARAGTQSMTIKGTVNRTAFFLGLVVLAAIFGWNRFLQSPQTAFPLLIGGSIGGLILAFVTCWKKEWAAITGSLYALIKGLVVGILSAMYEVQFNGIVLQATMLTFGTLFALLAAYRSGLIRATENFKLGIVAATGGIFLMYLGSLILRMFDVGPFFEFSSPMSIGISVVVVVIAALNLVLDFDFIESGEAAGAPKYMEWYAAFGLIVTLIWLYIEILRLLAKLSNRR